MSPDVVERYARLDPAASPAADAQWETLAPAILAAIQPGDPGVQQAPVRARPPAPRRRRGGVVMAAAAFVAVLLLVGAAALVSTSDSDEPPATTPPSSTIPTTTLQTAPSTTAAPEATTSVPPPSRPPATTIPPDAEEQAIVAALVAELNAGEVDALMARIGPETLLLWPTIAAGVGDPVPLPPERWGTTVVESFRHFAVTGSVFSIDSCRSLESGRTRCQGEYTSSLIDTMGRPSRLTVDVDLATDGTLAYLTLDFDAFVLSPAHGQFWDWIAEHYPGEEHIMWTGLAYPLGDEAALALWAERLPEYLESR